MGQKPSLAENQEVSHQSGASRLCNSMIGACCSPFVVIAAICIVGWNEKEAVCEAKAISEAKDTYITAGCTTLAADGDLVLIQGCEIGRNGLADLSPAGAFQSKIRVQGTGLRVVSEMYQCVENVAESTTKDSVGGGTTTVKTYTYSKAWREVAIDSSAFHRNPSTSNCDVGNPSWPTSAVPLSSLVYAPTVEVGAYDIGPGPGSYVESIPLSQPQSVTSSVPSGWSQTSVNGGVAYRSSQWSTSSLSGDKIGDVRMQFFSNDWNNDEVTVLGKNSGGKIGEWQASKSWGCSGNKAGTLMMGKVSGEKFFEGLKAEAAVVKWALRFLGFLIFWFGFSLLFGPLEVFADCIPCIGPCLGDSIAAITCCLSCLPACGCFMLIAGVVWVAMRPMVGGPMIAGFLCILCGYMAYKAYAKSKGAAEQGKTHPAAPDVETPAPETPATVVGGPVGEAPARPDAMGPFFDEKAPDGRPWWEVLAGTGPDSDGGELQGPWRECMVAAVEYEKGHDDWGRDPRFTDNGPAGQIMDYLTATSPDAMEAANATEAALQG